MSSPIPNYEGAKKRRIRSASWGLRRTIQERPVGAALDPGAVYSIEAVNKAMKGQAYLKMADEGDLYDAGRALAVLRASSGGRLGESRLQRIARFPLSRGFRSIPPSRSRETTAL